MRFDILPGQRERDIGCLIHALADLELDFGGGGDGDDDDDDEGAEYVEDRPLGGE
jgi:hypothetical protein